MLSFVLNDPERSILLKCNEVIKKTYHLAIYIFLIGFIAYSFAGEEGNKSIFSYESNVRTIVDGIISYSVWPNSHGLPHLCISSSALYMNILKENEPTHRANVYIPVIINNIDETLASQCDAIYFGNESPDQQAKLLQKKHSPILLISEQNSECQIGSAFCLEFKPTRVSFSVNLDSLDRCGVRVNPQVLILAN